MKKVLFLIIILIGSVWAQQQPQNGAFGTLPIFDFRGGTNTADFPTNLQDNEAVIIENLVFRNNILEGRQGYTLYNTTAMGNLRPYGLHRAGNKKLYLAYGQYLRKSNATDNGFQAVDSLADSIKSNEYLSFVEYEDTTHFVDGRNYWKTTGDSLLAGNVVAEGGVTHIPENLLGVNPDTVRFLVNTKGLGDINLIQIESDNTTPEFFIKDHYRVGRWTSDTARTLVEIDIKKYLQLGDTVLAANCSVYVSREGEATAESLYALRNTSYWSITTAHWGIKPTTSDTVGRVAINGVGWYTLDLTTWVNRVVQDSITNYGLTLMLRGEPAYPKYKIIQGYVDNGSKAPNLTIRRVPAEKTFAIQSSGIRDSLQGKLWSDDQWIGYFVEFTGQDTTNTLNRFRLINRSKDDTLIFSPPILNNTVIGQRYKIWALPTSIDKLYPKTGDSTKTLGNATYNTVQKTRRIYLGVIVSLTTRLLRNKTYFIRITSGRNQVAYQILDNFDVGGADNVIVYSSQANPVDSGSTWEIFQAIFPKCKYMTVRGNRAYFAGDSVNVNRVWFSEPKTLGEVGGINFIVVGGEPSEGQITSIRPLFASGYADPRNPLVIIKPKSLNALFGADPSTDVPIKVLDKFGTVSDRSVITVEGNLYFQNSGSGFYRTNLKDIELISGKLKAVIDSIADSTLYRTSVFYDNPRRTIFWNVTLKGGSNRVLAYNIDNGAWTTQTLKFGLATHVNLANDTIAPVLFSHPDSGIVYKWAIGTTDNGATYNATILTKWYDLGYPDWLKKIKSVRTLTNLVTGAIGLDVVTYRDFASTSSDSVQISQSGYKNSLAYFSKTPTGKLFRFKLKTRAYNFNFGKAQIDIQWLRKEGY